MPIMLFMLLKYITAYMFSWARTVRIYIKRVLVHFMWSIYNQSLYAYDLFFFFGLSFGFAFASV